MWHQYYPFFVSFREKLRSGGSLQYLREAGMGIGYLPLYAYYLSSPLYLLSVLVPASLLREFFALLVLTKIGLAGLFFAVFLRTAFRRERACARAVFHDVRPVLLCGGLLLEHHLARCAGPPAADAGGHGQPAARGPLPPVYAGAGTLAAVQLLSFVFLLHLCRAELLCLVHLPLGRLEAFFPLLLPHRAVHAARRRHGSPFCCCRRSTACRTPTPPGTRRRSCWR